MKTKKGAVAATLLALLVPLSAGLAASAVADRVEDWLARTNGASGRVLFELPPGQGAGPTARRLEELGLLEDARTFVLYLRLAGLGGKLQAGEYDIETPISPLDLARLLVFGRVLLHSVTIPEGLSLSATAAIFARSGLWSVEELEAAFRSPRLVRKSDPLATDLEGYLFPDTYHLARGTTAEDVAEVMVARSQEVLASVIARDEPAPSHGLGVRALLTLASLVERETARVEEYGEVAGVFHARLRKGMRLECDPTVIAALERDGKWNGGPLLKADLSYPSPYNTYVAPGLPPGPICSSGEGAIAAAYRPTETENIFFVAAGDGTHRFARTEAEHRRNVLAWRKIQREARRR